MTTIIEADVAAATSARPSSRSTSCTCKILSARRRIRARIIVGYSDGIRGLTHRRLEDEAGLARGSARYHLGTNDHIIATTLEHAALRESRMIETALAQLGLDALAGSRASLPKMAAALVSALLENPGAIRARYELLLGATRRPALKAEAQRWRAHFVDTTELALTTAGLDDPHTSALLLVAMIDGLTLDAVITDRTTAPELAERGAAAILHAYTATS